MSNNLSQESLWRHQSLKFRRYNQKSISLKSSVGYLSAIQKRTLILTYMIHFFNVIFLFFCRILYIQSLSVLQYLHWISKIYFCGCNTCSLVIVLTLKQCSHGLVWCRWRHCCTQKNLKNSSVNLQFCFRIDKTQFEFVLIYWAGDVKQRVSVAELPPICTVYTP